MSGKRFELTITVDVVLTTDEVWPDGDAPDNPTADDVRRVFMEGHSILHTARDWGLDDDAVIDVYEVKP